ncbi:uncharacterized protein LOC124449691 [Xenia sp. Carnegie-2017]|uniref:uncharacterized protein LOC124449691 n=1 Tax=Xenia sp. Carnegie-2017 TaxID=2897299 RepID=UPI001F04F04F|nr:uncharacterized protein LOC124449691 [Xenia sp. Carnegie-2017]
MRSSLSKFRGSYDLEYVSLLKNCDNIITTPCYSIWIWYSSVRMVVIVITCRGGSRAKFLSAVNEILSTNSRNLPVYSELISLAEKAPEILNTKDHAITSPSTSRTPSQRSGPKRQLIGIGLISIFVNMYIKTRTAK